MSRSTQIKRFEGLYVILDAATLGRRDPLRVAAQAIRGGARILQYRGKGVSDNQQYRTCVRLARLCKKQNVTFLVNDRVDIGLSSDARGVHVGAEDLPLGEVRKLLGASRGIGVSTHSVAEALRNDRLRPSYVALGPIYRSPTKRTRRVLLGIKGLKAVARRARCPIVAIGGLNVSNVGSVKEAGASAVAVISSVISAGNPRKAAGELVRQMEMVSTTNSRRIGRSKA